MRTSVSHSAYLIDFLDKDFSSDSVSQKVNLRIQDALSLVDISAKLDDWELILKAVYTVGEAVFLFRKGKSYPNEKYKELVVHIPMPEYELVSWGISRSQVVLPGLFKDSEIVKKNAETILVDPTGFSNREVFPPN